MLNQQSPLHRCCRSPASMRWPPHTLKKRTLFSLNVLQSICISISLIMYKLAFVVKVNTKHGTKMVLSVSKTFLKLKDLILEKNTLQEQVIHLLMIFTKKVKKRRTPYCSWSRWKQSTSTFALKSIFTRKSSAASRMNSTTHGKDLGLKSRMCKGYFSGRGVEGIFTSSLYPRFCPYWKKRNYISNYPGSMCQRSKSSTKSFTVPNRFCVRNSLRSGKCWKAFGRCSSILYSSKFFLYSMKFQFTVSLERYELMRDLWERGISYHTLLSYNKCST